MGSKTEYKLTYDWQQNGFGQNNKKYKWNKIRQNKKT